MVEETQLTSAELQQVRAIIQSQQRVKWLYSNIRIWAVWITAVAGGIYAVLSLTKDGLKTLFGGGH